MRMDDAADRKTLPRLDESLLTHLRPFARLDRRQIRGILDHASSRRHDAGTSIFLQGHPAERFYMLLDGYIRVARMSATGEQVTLHYIPSGEMFGIARAFRLDRYPATAVAAVECIGLSWPMHLWDTFVSEYEGLAEETFRTVGGRLSEKNDRIVELTANQVEQRIANALLRLVNQTGRKVEDGIEIDFPITRRDLSELTAATLHTVSRVLSGWEKRGLVESRRKRITVRDPHALMVLGQG
jgi:CRP-like cAMP-binding protein